MKISVIIPTFNAEQDIIGAIESIENGNVTEDFEIITVDDGSRDGTLSVLRTRERTDPHLNVLTQQNAGPAAARETGMRAAAGEWILFCDSDDRFVPGALDRVLSLAAGHDVLIFGYFLVRGAEKTPYRVKSGVLQTEEDWCARLGELYGANMLNQVWGKAFCREILTEDVRFPDLLWGEDRLFLFQVLEKAKSVCLSDACLYEYVQRPDSLISRFLPDKPEICHTIACQTRTLADKKGALTPANEAVFSYMYQKSLLSCLANLFSPSCTLSYREKRAFVKKVVRQEDPFGKTEPVPNSGAAFRVLAWALKTKCVRLNYFLARAVALSSRVLPGLFFRAKHALNQQEKEKNND